MLIIVDVPICEPLPATPPPANLPTEKEPTNFPVLQNMRSYRDELQV